MFQEYVFVFVDWHELNSPQLNSALSNLAIRVISGLRTFELFVTKKRRFIGFHFNHLHYTPNKRKKRLLNLRLAYYFG